MNRHDPLNIIANFIVLIGWLPALLFVVFYGMRSKWRATLAGRTLMYQSFGFWLVMTVVLIGIWFPDMPGRSLIRLLAYGFLVITMWRMFITLLRYQREEKDMVVEQKNKEVKPFL